MSGGIENQGNDDRNREADQPGKIGAGQLEHAVFGEAIGGGANKRGGQWQRQGPKGP